MKILIVDDHEVVRAGTRLLLKDIEEGVAFDEAENGCNALKKFRGNDYDVVLLDLMLPDISGFEVLETIKREKSSQPVIVLSMHDEEQYAVRAYALGADGYVNKGNTYSDLIHAIEKVLQGGKFVSELFLEAVIMGLRNSNPAEGSSSKRRPLSKREKEIAIMLVSGKSNKEIAWQLAISVKTVSTHKARILDKLNLKNLAQLVTYMHVAGMTKQMAFIT